MLFGFCCSQPDSTTLSSYIFTQSGEQAGIRHCAQINALCRALAYTNLPSSLLFPASPQYTGSGSPSTAKEVPKLHDIVVDYTSQQVDESESKVGGHLARMLARQHGHLVFSLTSLAPPGVCCSSAGFR